MIAVALKGLLGRKTRAILTALAIVLGIGDGQRAPSSSPTRSTTPSTASSRRRTSRHRVVVSGKQIVTGAANTPSVPASLVARIRAVPGVEAASGGFLFATVKLVERNGKAIGNGGPQFGFGVDPADKRFTPLALTTGRWPSGPGEIAIGAVTAAKEHFAVGDTIGAKGTGRVHHYTITGLAEIPGVSSGSATLAAFDVTHRAGPARQAGPLRQHLRGRQPRRHTACARSADPAAPLRDGDGAHVGGRGGIRQQVGRRAGSAASSTSCSRSPASHCSSAPSSSSTPSR